MTTRTLRDGLGGEAGFTLIEALMSIVILVFGLIAVTNLFIVAGTSNKAGNHGTATTAEATEVMEALKAVPFDTLCPGACPAQTLGSLTADLPGICNPDCAANPQNCPSQCVVANNFNYFRQVPGVGWMRTRWQISSAGAGGPATIFITVRSESVAGPGGPPTPIVGGARSRAEFTTFRACTSGGCP